MRVSHRGSALGLTLALVLLLSLGPASPAQAETFVGQGDLPFTLFAECLNGGQGDTLSGVVSFHFVTTLLDTGAGSILILQDTAHGELVSEATGEVYHLNASSTIRQNLGPGEAVQFQITEQFTVVSPGSGATFVAPTTIHLVITPNGEISALVLNGQLLCD